MRGGVTRGFFILYLFGIKQIQAIFTCHNIEDCRFSKGSDTYSLSNYWNCGLLKCLKKSNCSKESVADHVKVITTTGKLLLQDKISSVSYVNVSIFYSEGIHDEDRERKLLLYEEGEDGQCWEVNPRSGPPNPLPVPFLPNRRPIKVTQYSIDRECISLGRINAIQLTVLKDAREGQKISFSMPQVETKSPLFYQLFHSPNRSITCNGSLNEHSHFNIIYNSALNPHAPEMKVINEYFTLRLNVTSSGFYCMRIGLFECLRHTHTINVKMPEDNGYIPKSYITNFSVYPYMLAFLGATILSMCLLVGVAAKRSRRSVVRREQQQRISTEIVKGDNGTELSTSDISVLLLYPHTLEYKKVMNAFAIYMDYLNIRVWDPYSDVTADENSRAWTLEFLSRNSTRIILTETKETIKIADAWVSRGKDVKALTPPPPATFLDSYLTYAINAIYHDDALINNYSRLFIIRFDRNSGVLYNLVPNTRYHLPDNLSRLANNLLGYWSEPEYIDLNDPSHQERNLQDAIINLVSCQIVQQL